MKNFFSTMLTALSLVFFVFVGSAFTSINLTLSQARAFHTNVIDRVQSSMYSDEVIIECIEEAEQNGYTLTFENVTIYDERRDVKVTLEYSIPNWLSQEVQTGTLVGYAR